MDLKWKCFWSVLSPFSVTPYKRHSLLQLLIPGDQPGPQGIMLLWNQLSSLQQDTGTGEEGPADPSNGLCLLGVSTVCPAWVLFVSPSQSCSVPVLKGPSLSCHWRPCSPCSPCLTVAAATCNPPHVPCPQSHLSVALCRPWRTLTLVNTHPQLFSVFPTRESLLFLGQALGDLGKALREAQPLGHSLSCGCLSEVPIFF